MATLDNIFIIIPPHIRASEELTPLEKMVFGVVNGLTQKEGYCYASNDYIGELVGISSSMASKHISKLTKKGFIRLEILKIKRDERTGKAGEKYGTIRHIYIYQIPKVENPCPTNGAPPSTTNGEYIGKVESKELRRGSPNEPSPTTDFSQVGKDKRFKRLPMIDQLEVLKLTMGIYEKIDLGSLLDRIKKSSGRKEPLLTAYQWLFRDCLEGKIATNYYLEGFRDDLPANFEEAEFRMDRQLFLPKFKMELIDGETITTPGINKTNPDRLDELKEKLEKLESVEMPKYDL